MRAESIHELNVIFDKAASIIDSCRSGKECPVKLQLSTVDLLNRETDLDITHATIITAALKVTSPFDVPLRKAFNALGNGLFVPRWPVNFDTNTDYMFRTITFTERF